MNNIQNHMRAQALLAGNGRASVRLGTVDAYDPGHYAVKVSIQPEGTVYGWMPLLSPWVGNGWGLFTPPAPGDQIMVFFQEGDREVPLAGMRIFNDADRPLPCPSGEAWMVHQSGNYLKFQNDGTVQGHGPLTWDGDATITGNLTVQKNITGQQSIMAQQDISDQGGKHGTIGQLRTDYDQHTHGGIQPGSGNTSTPNLTI